MSKTRCLALFAMVCYAGTLLITAPASLVDRAIGSLSNGRLSLANCQGTIWQGSATPALHAGQNAIIPLHTLNWAIKPQALLQGKLSANISWDNPKSAAPMELTLAWGSVILKNVLLPLPAEVIGELSPFLKPARFSGNLRLESRQLTLDGNHLQGQATALWDQAGSALSPVHPLGDYRLDIVATQDNLHATLTTRAGALLLGGQGIWSPAQGVHFDGTASSSEAAGSMLAELLHHLGPEITPGVYKISL